MDTKAPTALRCATWMVLFVVVSSQYMNNTQPLKTDKDCICNVNDTVCRCTFTIHHRLTMVLDQERELVKPVNGELQFASGDQKGQPLSLEQTERVITGDGEGSRLVIAINDIFPGPRIEVYENQILELKVINTLHTDSITIHFHGLHQKDSPWMDGVAFITQCPIMPGQTFVYKFSAYPPGTAMYHAHIGDQRSMGLYGPLIVRKWYDVKEPPEKTDEIIVTIQDWNHDMDAETGYHRMITEQFYPDGTKINTTESVDGGNFSRFHFHSGLFNGKGRYWNTTADHNSAPLERFNVNTTNTYRFRVIGAMTLYPMRVFILGQKINLTASDGFGVTLNQLVHSIIVHPGERYDFEWTVPSMPQKHMFLIAESLETQQSIGNEYHAAEAILEVTDHPDLSDINPDIPKTDTKCTPDSKCKVFNCPFHYIGRENYECLDLNSLKNTNDSRQKVEENSVNAEYFFNFAFPGPQGNTPGSVNAHKFVSPPSPTLTQPNAPGTVPCDNSSCSDGVCSCMYEQVIPHNSLIQMTFLNLGSGAGWSHPVHLHGHSFYVMKMGLGNRMIILHAGVSGGFFPNAGLVFKSRSSSGDYHDEMNHVNFMKWLREKLIPNLPGKSVVILDNASYHNVQVDRCPTQCTRKADIQAWLQRNGINYSPGMLKPELLTLCKIHRRAPVYVVDEELEKHGHRALRLPPYHADLNAIELIWSQLKDKDNDNGKLGFAVNSPDNATYPTTIKCIYTYGTPMLPSDGTYNMTTGRLISSTNNITCTDSYGYCSEAAWTDPSWARGNVPDMNDNPPEKDTIIIPTGGYVVIRFRSDNPGKWFLHCHIDLHNTNGMGMVISEAPELIPSPPTGFPVCGNFMNDVLQDTSTAVVEECKDLTVAVAVLAAFFWSHTY